MSKLESRQRDAEEMDYIIRTWLSTDILYNILPIMITIFISFTLKEDLYQVFSSSEWSFTAIVLFGSAISSMTEIARIRRDLKVQHSININGVLPIFLIGSAIILAFAIINNKNLNIIYSSFINVAQQIVFWSAIFLSLLMRMIIINSSQPPKFRDDRSLKRSILFVSSKAEEISADCKDCHIVLDDLTEALSQSQVNLDQDDIERMRFELSMAEKNLSLLKAKVDKL